VDDAVNDSMDTVPVRRHERWAMPLAIVLLTFVLLEPVITARRLASSNQELAHVSAGREALVDLQLAISQTTASALSPMQDSATHARLRIALAQSDSAADRLRAAATHTDADVRAAVDTLMLRLRASRIAPFAQASATQPIVRADSIGIDRSSRLTDLLEATADVDSALTLTEARAATQARRVIDQGTTLTIGLALASVTVAFLMAWLSSRLRGVTAELARRVESESRARAAADTAVAQRDQVLRIVSHDLKNPLLTIGMAVNVASEMDMPQPVRDKQLEIIERSVDRMGRLVADLLDVARLESGQPLAVTPRPLPLADMLAEAREIFAEQAKSKSVTLDVHADVGTRVIADRDRVVQVLSNLLGNAIKFTPPNGVVRVEAQPNGRYATVAVANNGPPISPDLLPRIFKPFSQAKDTAGLGTGLGLSIAKGIVEAHGGRIQVASEPGRETRFEFTLPIEQPQQPARS
jgi:signal transduction histidine kinase